MIKNIAIAIFSLCILVLLYLLYGLYPSAKNDCEITVTMSKCYTNDYTVVANVVEASNPNMVLPVTSGSSSSGIPGKSIIRFTATCQRPGQDKNMIKIKASYTYTGERKNVALRPNEFYTTVFQAGKSINVIFPDSFIQPHPSPCPQPMVEN